MLSGLSEDGQHYPGLVVGNSNADDAAVYAINDEQAVISTTDFFMPVVDDPYEFGRIAAANAISDVYAMGGKPLMALAILGWPADKLPPDVGREVLRGGRDVCREAGMPLAGGHSIDAPEPIFGLSVNGLVNPQQIKRNLGARPGDLLFLTKPIGVGVLTTAIKKKKCSPQHEQLVLDTMCQLNKIGSTLGQLEGVHAMTDVTGFGLLGHLLEICLGSGTNAVVMRDQVPLLDGLHAYLDAGCAPAGSRRNYASYRQHLPELSKRDMQVYLDPQTSGGLLVAVDPADQQTILALAEQAGVPMVLIGSIEKRKDDAGEQPRIVLK